jgi:hypothetical protein
VAASVRAPVRLNYNFGRPADAARGDHLLEPSSGNFGDLLSPLLVAALSGQLIRHVPHRSLSKRLVAVGTIGQRQKFGHAQLWGTGFDG